MNVGCASLRDVEVCQPGTPGRQFEGEERRACVRRSTLAKQGQSRVQWLTPVVVTSISIVKVSAKKFSRGRRLFSGVQLEWTLRIIVTGRGMPDCTCYGLDHGQARSSTQPNAGFTFPFRQERDRHGPTTWLARVKSGYFVHYTPSPLFKVSRLGT